MTIHIEGMGVLGCQVAMELDRLGIDFTWSDTDEPFTAWHCSTGIVYPSGEERDLAGLRAWVEQIEAGRHYPYAAKLPYVYAHKNPPHGGRYTARPVPGTSLSMASETSVAVNVPAMVGAVRGRHQLRRVRETPDSAGLVIRAYADPDKLDGYLWGWAARVSFDHPLDGFPTYYAKAHRFNLTYAYPIPHGERADAQDEHEWWAGSTLLHQRSPSHRDTAPYLAEWLENAERLLGITNVHVHDVQQGWRPRRDPNTPNEAREVEPGVWQLAPEPTSGVRHGPLIINDLFERIGL